MSNALMLHCQKKTGTMNQQKNKRTWKTRHQMAADLNISYTTFWRMLKEIDIKPPSGLLSPTWQTLITQALEKVRENGSGKTDEILWKVLEGFERFLGLCGSAEGLNCVMLFFKAFMP